MSVKVASIAASIFLHGVGLCAIAAFGGGLNSSISKNGSASPSNTVFEISFEDSSDGNDGLTSTLTESEPTERRAQLKQSTLTKILPREKEIVSLSPKRTSRPQAEKPSLKQSNITGDSDDVVSTSSLGHGNSSSLGGSSFGGPIGNNSAQILNAPRPSYPPRARKLGAEGAVILLANVLPSGEVGDAVIEKSSGRNDLDESARETVMNLWRFIPAKNQGISVASSERVIVMFKLTDSLG